MSGLFQLSEEYSGPLIHVQDGPCGALEKDVPPSLSLPCNCVCPQLLFLALPLASTDLLLLLQFGGGAHGSPSLL